MLKIRLIKKKQKGQALVEYATIISLVSIVSIVILSGVGIAVSRNYATVAAVFGAKKNAANNNVSGLINTIYVDMTPGSQPTCHVAKPTSTYCASNGCTATGTTFVTLTLYASPDIQ